MNPINSIHAAIVSGGVLAVIVFIIVPGSGCNEFSLAAASPMHSCSAWAVSP